jgi:kinesin family protein C1
MIPRAVSQVFKAADDLKSKGWEYKMDGQFLEIVRILSLHRRDLIDKKMSSITKQSTTSLERVSSTRRSMISNTTSPVLVSPM